MNKKILIIDDDEDIVDIVSYILTLNGYDVEGPKTSDLLNDIYTIKPDLILLDYRLKFNRSGGELCKAIKTNNATKHIQVVMFSALDNLAAVSALCLADNFICKPFDLDELEKAVANALNQTSPSVQISA